MSPKKDTHKPAPAAAGEQAAGFTEDERAAMRERAEELKAARGGKVDGEAAVLAKIAEMEEPDRSMAARLHEIIRASAPGLVPRLWYGMPAYAREGKVVCFFQGPISSRPVTPPSASATRRISTMASCGRWLLPCRS